VDTQLLRNLKAGIKYSHFVSNLDFSQEVAHLVYALATTDVGSSGAAGGPSKDLIAGNLQLLQGGLSINLSPGQVSFEFRLHNAFEPDRAVCYLRHGTRRKYFEWVRNRDAVGIARGLREIALQDDDLDEPISFVRPGFSI
jgi:hypothetical protein